MTRNSGDASSTPISADEWKNVRTIVLTNTSTTSMTSTTLSSASTALSIASSHAGTPGGYAAVLAPKRLETSVLRCPRARGSSTVPAGGVIGATSSFWVPCRNARNSSSVEDNEKLIFMVQIDNNCLS